MYVKTTKVIWGEIESRIATMFQARFQVAYDWYSYGLTKEEFDKRCFDSVFPTDKLEAIYKIAEFFDLYDYVNVKIKPDPDGIYEQYKLQLDHKMPMSEKWHSYPYRIPEITDSELVKIAARRREAIRREEAERDALLEKLRSLYNQAPSVNALLKAWPPIIELLPNDVVEKCNRKTERQAFEKKVIETDAAALSTSLLKAKICA